MKFITIIGVGLIGSSIARAIKTIDGKIQLNIIDNKRKFRKKQVIETWQYFSLDIDKQIEKSISYLYVRQ